MRWERVWPPLAAALTLCAIFLAVSWLGLWIAAPPWLRIIGSVAFLLALLACFAPLARTRRLSRTAALARVDRDSASAHRAASSLGDQLANGGSDPTTSALWAVHLHRLEQAAGGLRVAWPSPRLVERDRYAVRAAALIALFASAFVAGHDKQERLLAAFDWSGGPALAADFRLDAWIDPPGYTGRPPLLLTGFTPNRASPPDAERTIGAPVGSSLIVRSEPSDGVSIAIDGRLAAAPAPAKAAGTKHDHESRWLVRGDGRVRVRHYGRTLLSATITAIPDRPPTIQLLRAPRATRRGSMILSYRIADDYGVVGAQGRFAHPSFEGAVTVRGPLASLPTIPLSLPLGSHGLGNAQTTADLSESPWAGARVTMTLAAKDNGGNEGLSDPVAVALPQRAFSQPLARALVEQRRILLLDPGDRSRVSEAIAALMIGPRFFHESPAVYLGLSSISARLTSARSDADLLSVGALMWEMAVRIEDGDLSRVERDLRAAQKKLQDALQHGASDKELRKLTAQLRARLEKFLQALAQQQKNGASTQAQAGQSARAVTPKDLQSMIDRMQAMAQAGDRAGAQRMLERLQNLLENLQTAQGRPSPMGRAMSRALSQLDRMTQDQQRLRDKTFQHGEGRSQTPRAGKSGQQQRGESSQSLLQSQGDLRRRLDELRRQIERFGMNPKKGLSQAEGAMREAERGLGRGATGANEAVQAQGRALQDLQRGAQSLARQMRQNGVGEGQMAGRDGRGGWSSDPLGRQSRSFDPLSRYDPLGAPAAERAQQVLQELRRKLAKPGRPRDERDYIERLLRPY